MSNRPWMPLYIPDYLADTAHLGALESGAYLHLIMHYWQKGSLPPEEAHLARIARLTPDEWARCRDTLTAFFGDHWSHKRVDAELAKSEEISNKRRSAVLQRRDRSSTFVPTIVPTNEHTRARARPVTVTVIDTNTQSKEISSKPARAKNGKFHYPGEFLILWDTYPSVANQSKHEACKSWLRLTPEERDACLDGTMLYEQFLAKERAKRPDYPGLHLATFINQRRFETLVETEKQRCAN